MGPSPHSDPEALLEVLRPKSSNKAAAFVRCIQMAERRVHRQMSRPGGQHNRPDLLPVRFEDGDGRAALISDKDSMRARVEYDIVGPLADRDRCEPGHLTARETSNERYAEKGDEQFEQCSTL